MLDIVTILLEVMAFKNNNIDFWWLLLSIMSIEKFHWEKSNGTYMNWAFETPFKSEKSNIFD